MEGPGEVKRGMTSRNAGAACRILVLRPGCVGVVALLVRVGICTGKGEIQVCPGSTGSV